MSANYDSNYENLDDVKIAKIKSEIETQYTSPSMKQVDESNNAFINFYSSKITIDPEVSDACLYVEASANNNKLNYLDTGFLETVYLYFFDGNPENSGHLSFYKQDGGIEVQSSEKTIFLFDMKEIPLIELGEATQNDGKRDIRFVDALDLLQQKSRGKIKVYFGGFVSTEKENRTPGIIHDLRIYYKSEDGEINIY